MQRLLLACLVLGLLATKWSPSAQRISLSRRLLLQSNETRSIHNTTARDQLLTMARAANGSELALEAAAKVEPVVVSEALVVLGECS